MKDKQILITGATNGIGLAVAEALVGVAASAAPRPFITAGALGLVKRVLELVIISPPDAQKPRHPRVQAAAYRAAVPRIISPIHAGLPQPI